MHFAFITMPAHGHVNPALPLVRELVRRGHRVSFGTTEEFATAIRAAGAEPVLVPFELPSPPGPGKMSMADPAVLNDRVDSFLRSVENTFPIMLEYLTANPADVVCGEGMVPTAELVAAKLDIPMVTLNPTHATNEKFSLRDIMASSPEAQTFSQVFEKFGTRVREYAVKQGIKQEIGLFSHIAPLNLVFLPKEFQLAGETFDERFVFLGPSIAKRTDHGEWTSPGDPLLFISLGTVFNSHPDFYRQCLAAFGDSEWKVALNVGKNIDMATLGTIPANIEVREHFPQLDVLRAAKAFVSHAGMNSTMEALYFGVPLIALPQQPEQEANARRVNELGYGVVLDRDTISAESLCTTVTEVANDPTILANLATMSATLQARDGAVLGADALEAHLR